MNVAKPLFSVDEGFEVRGFLLDVTRDRVPTRGTLAWLVALLARCGYNQLQLYIEHAFAYTGHREVWGEADPLDAADLSWLDGLCAANGIVLVPAQNTLGHFDRWLKLPAYADRAESRGGFRRWGQDFGPATLQPTDENQALVQGLLDDVTAPVSGWDVNICCDEPFELGEGRSKALAGEVGVAALHRDWLLRTARPWLDEGWRVWFWADLLVDHPGETRDLPDDLVPIVWTYDAPTGPDPDAGFRRLALRAAEAGSRFAVAPGTGTWNTVTGRLGNCLGNLVDAAAVGLEFDAVGSVLTCWGDNGHWPGYAHAVVPIIAGGWVASHPDRADDVLDPGFLAGLVSRAAFGGPGHTGAELLVRSGHLEELFGCDLPNSSVAFEALFTGRLADGVTTAALDAVETEVGELRQLASSVADAGWVADITNSLDLCGLAVDRLRGGEGFVGDDLLRRVRRRWFDTSRAGGLEESIARIRRRAPR